MPTNDKYAHILQQNLNRGITTSPDIYLRIQHKLVTTPGLLVALQEPQVKDGFITVFPDNHLIYHRSPNGVPRAALFISNGLHVAPLPTYMDADMATGLWTTNDPRFKHIVVSSIYMAGDMAITNKFTGLLEFCKRKRLPYILMADTNSHTPMWGEDHTCPRGSVMESIIMRHAPSIINRGTRPHFYTWKRNDSESIIDVTFCSSDLEPHLKNWRAEWKVHCDSDHSTISFDFQIDTVHYTNSRNYRRNGWNKFSTMMEEHSETYPKPPPSPL